jgi:signal peptidase I
VVVKKDSLFVMGDNRDRSYDSRFFGFINENQIKGKVLYVYWAKDKSRIGTHFESCP